MIMLNQRIISRSIIIDPVNDRIEQLRFTQHRDSLAKITHSPSAFQSATSSAYITQIEKYKRSNSYVKNMFDSRLQDNQTLVKRMLDIDRRKSPFPRSPCKEGKRLPAISDHRWERQQAELHKENSKLVERILMQRKGRSKEGIAREGKVY